MAMAWLTIGVGWATPMVGTSPKTNAAAKPNIGLDIPWNTAGLDLARLTRDFYHRRSISSAQSTSRMIVGIDLFACRCIEDEQ
jgi:hypothetical protein